MKLCFLGNASALAASLVLLGGVQVRAQDALSLGEASGPAGGVVAVPIHLRDRPGTALDSGAEAQRAIQSLSLAVRPSLPEAVESIDFERSGVIESLEPRFESQQGETIRRSWILSFDDGIPLSGGLQQIGTLHARLAAGLAPGTEIDLELEEATTALASGSGAIVETTDSGDLSLADGRIEVISGGCSTGTVLCLLDDRFKVEVSWRDFQGGSGVGQASRLTEDSGYFWFFNQENVELVIKTLDGRAINGHFWVFYGALSNVEYEITVTDSVTGLQRMYSNPSGTFASVGDTEAFQATEALVDGGSASVTTPISAGTLAILTADAPMAAGGEQGACVGDSTHLCLLDRRFQLAMTWTDFQGKSGVGQAEVLTNETGYFWFFNPDNVEIIVKTLDARALNGHFWVFYGALSNVEFTLEVSDTVSGATQQYNNPSGTFASVGDTEAFPQ